MRTTTTITAISFLIVLAASQFPVIQSGSIKPANISGDISVTFTQVYGPVPYFGLALTNLLDTYSPNSIYRLQTSVVSVSATVFTIGWNYSASSSFSQAYRWVASNNEPLITSTFLLSNIAQGNNTLDLTKAFKTIPIYFFSSLTLYVDFLIYGFVINTAAEFN